MIATTIIVMTLLGCHEATTDCDIVSETPHVWSSLAQCEQGIPKVLESSSALSYPTVAARCDVVFVAAPPTLPTLADVPNDNPDEENNGVYAYLSDQATIAYEPIRASAASTFERVSKRASKRYDAAKRGIGGSSQSAYAAMSTAVVSIGSLILPD